MDPEPSHHLLRLPEEILISIFAQLDFPSLYQALYVCKHFHHLAEPNLYREVQILDSEQGSALSYSLRNNVQRCRHVRNLLVSTKLGHEGGLMGLPPYLAQMHNLTHLRLETPDCNTKEPEERIDWVLLQDRYERVFEQSSLLVPPSATSALPNLTSCTLHFVDSHTELYPLTRYSILFLHPNLRSLTISCASTDLPENFAESFRKDQSLQKSTRLEELHLEECDIFSPTLSMLLTLPRALKRLTISEGIRYDGLFSPRSSRMHGNVQPAEFVDALTKSTCIDTLESLSLNLGYWRHHGQHITQFGQHLNLTSFHSLRYLELSNFTLDLFRLHPDCDHQTWRRFPPGLQTLKIFEIPLGRRPPFQAFRSAYFPLQPCLIQDKPRHGLPCLSTLVLSYEYYSRDADPDDADDDEYPWRVPRDEDGRRISRRINQVALAQARLREVCRVLKPTLVKANVILEVEMKVLPVGYIPPYLWPEEKPRGYLFWESVPEVAEERGGE